MELDHNSHSVFLVYYHLVMVIKYRRKVRNGKISERAKEIFEYIAPGYGIVPVSYTHLARCFPDGEEGFFFPRSRKNGHRDRGGYSGWEDPRGHRQDRLYRHRYHEKTLWEKRLLLPLKKRLIHQTKLIRRLYSAKIRSCAVFFFWMDKGIFLYYNDVRYYLF